MQLQYLQKIWRPSLCRKTRTLQLIKGEEVLTKYTFGTGIAEHPFCSICGIKSFYRPRAYPAGISINANCIDPDQIHGMKVVRQFDGQNWEEAMKKRNEGWEQELVK